jgi:glutamate/tyrosine decarboxylase-like PLP-dependent enzyme
MPNPAFETMKKTTSNSSTSQDSLNSAKEASSHFGALFASRWCVEPISRFEIPEQGMPSQAAYQLIRDELALDGSPVLNLASFVTTFMEPEAGIYL